MAQFDTDHILTVIIQDALRDHETNRRVIEALAEFRLGNQEQVVDTILESSSASWPSPRTVGTSWWV